MRGRAAGTAAPAAYCDPDHFADWIRPHWSAMHALACRMSRAGTSEDVLQESLVDAWRHRARFDPARGEPRAWLLSIVANQARRSHRGVRISVLVDESSASEMNADQEARLDLTEALQQLTDRQKLAVSLHYYLGMSIDECSAVMRCTAGTVKSTLSDARRRLRERLGERNQ